MKAAGIALLLCVLTGTRVAWAGDLPPAAFPLSFPLACAPGKDCWIVNYVDAAPGRDAKDYTCGPRSYDGHDGIDIGLPDRAAMETGVAVKAAADGKVERVRDGMEDGDPDDDEVAALLKADKGCGNGVLIDHGEGWKTIYCHMKDGSIGVEPGRAVKAGDPLGLAGQSGAAQFPHLHFAVLKDGRPLDPMTGRAPQSGCGGDGKGFFSDAARPAYEPMAVYAAGFHKGLPDFEALKIDSAPARSLDDSPAPLTLWAAFYGLRKGDRIAFSITGPDGTVMATQDFTQDRDRARQFYYIGKRGAGGAWPKGVYKGAITVSRAAKGAQPAIRRAERETVIR